MPLCRARADCCLRSHAVQSIVLAGVTRTSNVSHSVQIMAAEGNASARYPGHPLNACNDLGCTQVEILSNLCLSQHATLNG